MRISTQWINVANLKSEQMLIRVSSDLVLNSAHLIIIDIEARCVLWQIGWQAVELQVGTVDRVEWKALGQNVVQ